AAAARPAARSRGRGAHGRRRRGPHQLRHRPGAIPAGGASRRPRARPCEHRARRRARRRPWRARSPRAPPRARGRRGARVRRGHPDPLHPEDLMTRSAAEPAPSSGPLAGIVVADLSRVLAGPYAAMLLGDLGATVIKVEHPDGDETRGFRPPVRDDEATYFLSANRNKQGIVLDFADAEQLATAHAIVDRADIVVENFRPGSLARFGLDHASLAERRP